MISNEASFLIATMAARPCHNGQMWYLQCQLFWKQGGFEEVYAYRTLCYLGFMAFLAARP
jgi:hypothetical protein